MPVFIKQEAGGSPLYHSLQCSSVLSCIPRLFLFVGPAAVDETFSKGAVSAEDFRVNLTYVEFQFEKMVASAVLFHELQHNFFLVCLRS